jgi:hypothetical protein
MNNLENILINDIVIIGITLFLFFFISYFKEKGKNLATQEDIKDITKKIESVKSVYEKKHINLQKELDSKIEIMKAKLKTTEIYFQKQLEALEEFLKIYRKIYPKYDMPDKDWYDACIDIIDNLSIIEKKFNDFLDKYEAYLPEETIKRLENIIFSSIDASFNIGYKNSLEEDIGDSILKDLKKAKENFVNEIKSNILF